MNIEKRDKLVTCRKFWLRDTSPPNMLDFGASYEISYRILWPKNMTRSLSKITWSSSECSLNSWKLTTEPNLVFQFTYNISKFSYVYYCKTPYEILNQRGRLLSLSLIFWISYYRLLGRVNLWLSLHVHEWQHFRLYNYRVEQNQFPQLHTFTKHTSTYRTHFEQKISCMPCIWSYESLLEESMLRTLSVYGVMELSQISGHPSFSRY